MRSELELPGRLLLDHPRARDLYPDFQAVGYHLTVGMVGLMETALARARALSPGDEVAAGIVEYLARHIVEEMHGAGPGDTTLDDLAAIGVDVVRVRAQPPPPKVSELVGAQYFRILRHPVAIVGYLELEEFHPHAQTVERLIENTGLPRAGFRNLLLHAKLDAVHARELHRVYDSLPLEPHHERLVGESALQTIALVVGALLDVVGYEAPVPLHAG